MRPDLLLFGVTSSFELDLEIETRSVVTAGNILRVTPPGTNDCRPCLSLDENHRLRGHLYFASMGWWKFATTGRYTLAPLSVYRVRLTLENRRLTLKVHKGTTMPLLPDVDTTTGLALSGEFPSFDHCVFYIGQDNDGQVADLFVDLDSITLTKLHASHKTFAFDFESSLLANSVKFFVGFDAPSLSHGAEMPAYARKFGNKAVLAPGRAAGHTAARFDKRSALVLASSLPFLQAAHTLCVWMQRTEALSTLYTTIAGFDASHALRYYAYFDQLAYGNLRNSSVAAGQAWTHLCASLAPGGQTVLYVNATRVAVGAVAPPSSRYFGMGGALDARGYSNRGFGGLIDEAVAWARQLSDAEIAQVYRA